MNGPEICFILYRPAVPGNIGATARAIKTMGFDQLRLIDPADHLCDEARMMAHGSHDVLEKSMVFPTFPDAVADIDFIVCTTAKKKNAKVDYLSSTELKNFLADKMTVTRRIGIVFGTEESGLPNSILMEANVGVTIPMSTIHPSLNLSQSVMVIAYELSGLMQFRVPGPNVLQSPQNIQPQDVDLKKLKEEEKKQSANKVVSQQATVQHPEAWRQLQERTSSILQQSGIQPGSPLYHRIMERMSFLKASDARLVHSVTSKVKELLDQFSRE